MKQKFLRMAVVCALSATCLGGFVACEKGGDEQSVVVSDISLDKTELTLEVGQEGVLTATLSPDDATDKTIIWSSDAEAVVTVENGTVKAVAEGSATVTASAGGKSASCSVTVLPLKMTEEEWKQALTDSFEARNVTLYTNSYELAKDPGGELFVFCYFDWENNVLATLSAPGQTVMNYAVFKGDVKYIASYSDSWNVSSSEGSKEEFFDEWMEVVYEEVIGLSDVQALWQAYDTCEFDQATNTYTVSLDSYEEKCTYKVAFRNGKVYEITEVGDSDSYTTRFVDYGTTTAVLPDELKTAMEQYISEEE
jgi:hypothetical protein